MTAASSAVDMALEALMEYAGARRHEMTQLEVEMWLRFIETTNPQTFIRFLSSWAMRSPFVPTPADAAKAMGLVQSPEQAFEAVLREVKQSGPYATPSLDKSTTQAIHLLGGWARVCEEVPDPGQEFAFQAYRKRFIDVYPQAQSQVEVQGVEPPRLLGLVESSRQHLALAMSRQQGALSITHEPAEASLPAQRP